jgi:hypothetical protein
MRAYIRASSGSAGGLSFGVAAEGSRPGKNRNRKSARPNPAEGVGGIRCKYVKSVRDIPPLFHQCANNYNYGGVKMMIDSTAGESVDGFMVY